MLLLQRGLLCCFERFFTKKHPSGVYRFPNGEDSVNGMPVVPAALWNNLRLIEDPSPSEANAPLPTKSLRGATSVIDAIVPPSRKSRLFHITADDTYEMFGIGSRTSRRRIGDLLAGSLSYRRDRQIGQFAVVGIIILSALGIMKMPFDPRLCTGRGDFVNPYGERTE